MEPLYLGLVGGGVGGAATAGARGADGAHGALPAAQTGGGGGRGLEDYSALGRLNVTQNLQRQSALCGDVDVLKLYLSINPCEAGTIQLNEGTL